MEQLQLLNPMNDKVSRDQCHPQDTYQYAKYIVPILRSLIFPS